MSIEIRYQDFDNTAEDYGKYFLWNTAREEREDTDVFDTEAEAAERRDFYAAQTEYTPDKYQLVVAVYNENCVRAGQPCLPREGYWNGHDYPLGDVTIFKGTEDDIAQQGRDYMSRGDAKGGPGGLFLSRIGRALIEAAGGTVDENEE